MKWSPASLPRLWRAVLAFMMALTLLGALLPGVALAAPPESAAQSTAQSGWGCTYYHTVRYGETLYRIAARYGVTIQAIMQANGIWNPNRIYAGQRLCIPGAVIAPIGGPGCACRTWHLIRRGETLSGIARWYGVSMQSIAQCNGIWNWNHIVAGTRLCIPGGYAPPPPPPLPPPPPPPPPPAYGVWFGEYYANKDFAAPPTFVRQDNAIAFDWGTFGPGGGMPATNFSVKWTQTAWLTAGTYRFFATVDDGVRIYVDDRLVVDAWRVGPALSVFGDVTLDTGWHTIRVEYFQEGGVAVIYVRYAKL